MIFNLNLFEKFIKIGVKMAQVSVSLELPDGEIKVFKGKTIKEAEQQAEEYISKEYPDPTMIEEQPGE